ncbi:MAG: hypothetical protein EZS28_021078, partial [Streblomastix strix]
MKNKENNKLRKIAIGFGVIDAYLNIFTSYDLSIITYPYIEAFFSLTYPSGHRIIQRIISHNPYQGLIRLLDHTASEIIIETLSCIENILSVITISSPESNRHPHYDIIVSCNGINKILNIFKQTKNKTIKDRSAICYGLLLRGCEITDSQLKNEVIANITQLISNPDTQIKNHARLALDNLQRKDRNQRSDQPIHPIKQIARLTPPPKPDALLNAIDLVIESLKAAKSSSYLFEKVTEGLKVVSQIETCEQSKVTNEMRSTTKKIKNNCMNIIKSKIKKNEEVELGFRTGLISEFIEIMKRLPYNELRKDVQLLLPYIIHPYVQALEKQGVIKNIISTILLSKESENINKRQVIILLDSLYNEGIKLSSELQVRIISQLCEYKRCDKWDIRYALESLSYLAINK